MGLENRSELGEPPEDPHVAGRLPHALTAGEEASMTTTEKKGSIHDQNAIFTQYMRYILMSPKPRYLKCTLLSVKILLRLCDKVMDSSGNHSFINS